jgi:hypothetical protein
VSDHGPFVHDMKNMLGIILGYSNLVLDDLPDGDPQRKDLEEIHKAAESALALLAEWASRK